MYVRPQRNKKLPPSAAAQKKVCVLCRETMEEEESPPLLPAVSPRSVAANRVVDDMSAMECSDDDSCVLASTTAEMPSILPSLMIELLGYPFCLPAMLVCRSWQAQGERIFRSEFSELRGACRSSAEYLDLPPNTKCTISIDFSPDRRRFASTHGDHTVKIVDFSESRVVATLRGHPRTPWTVKFHPTDLDVVASGCLGFQTRIWNVSTERCVYRTEFDRAIISLSFHPAGDILAVAAGASVYLWRYASGSAPMREFLHSHPIRCLRFLQQTGSLVIGAVNGTPTDGQLFGGTASAIANHDASQRRHRTTFQLIICDFDLEEARRSSSSRSASRSTVALSDDYDVLDPIAREAARLRASRRGNDHHDPPVILPVPGNGLAISNEPRCVLRHALFYNDGGFDISPCGTYLCSCAELWFPQDEQDGAFDNSDGSDGVPYLSLLFADDDNDNDEEESFVPLPAPRTIRDPSSSARLASRRIATTTAATTSPPPPPTTGRITTPERRRTGPPRTPTTAGNRHYDIRVDAESEAPNEASLTDNERPTRRRTRSTASIGGEEARYSSSDSEVKSRRRYEPLVDEDFAPPSRQNQALALSSREQQWLEEQLVLQEQLQTENAPQDQEDSSGIFSLDERRRPSLPTPRRSLCDDSSVDDDDEEAAEDAGMFRRFEDMMNRMAQRGEGVRFFPPNSQRTKKKKKPDLSALTAGPATPAERGKYIPHLVVVSLVESVKNRTTDEDEGKLIQATALDDHSFSGVIGQTTGLDIVTSVKFSPTTSLILLGHSRGGDGTAGEGIPRVVSAVYRVGDMKKVDTRKEVGDDVNIARFHPDSGVGIVYGKTLSLFFQTAHSLVSTQGPNRDVSARLRPT